MKNEKEKIKEEENTNKTKKEKKKIPIPKYNSFNNSKQSQDKKNTKNIEDISNENKILSSIFFKKYKPLKIIGAGTFSVVYEGININNKEKVALKIEQKNAEISLLEKEAFSIFYLQGFGIIKFISFGHNTDFNILVEPLLGKSLYNLYLDNKKSFNLKDICLIGIQCLDRLEHIHSKGFIHGDIKPENFLIGLNDPRIIYIIDFGLSKKYRSDRTGKHINFKVTKRMSGTARYASTNSLRGVEISRRDDLESLAYMIIYFIMKKLPWQGVKANSQKNRYKKIYYMKKKFCEEENFKDLPIEIQNFYKTIKKLSFEEDPNYIILKGFFRELLNINNFQEDGNFSWINDKSIIEAKIETNLRKRKSNSQKRLMDKLIKNSTDGERINSGNELVINPKKNRLSKNIVINNDYIYSSNNKEIKSINEAIVDVGEYSDNDEEKINNFLKLKKIRNSSNENIKKQTFYTNFNSNDNCISNKIKTNNEKNIYHNKIKKYTSFNQNNAKKKEESNDNNINNNHIKNYKRCNVGKNYIINERKNLMKKEENEKIDINIQSKNKNADKENNNFSHLNKRRSKSGEKCLIQ